MDHSDSFRVSDFGIRASRSGSLWAPALFALRSVRRRPLQTGLMVFALAVALGATMAIMAILAGIRAQVQRDLERTGTDVINIHLNPYARRDLYEDASQRAAPPPATPEREQGGEAEERERPGFLRQLAELLGRLGNPPLRMDDLAEFRRITGGQAAPANVSRGLVRLDASRATTALTIATTSDWAEVAWLEYIAGRFFRPDEPDACVFDEYVADQLGGASEVIGRTVQITIAGETRAFEVVGVLHDPFEIRERFEELDVSATTRSPLLSIMEFRSVYLPRDPAVHAEAIHAAVTSAGPGRDARKLVEKLSAYLAGRSPAIAVWARRTWIDALLQATDLGIRIADLLWIIVLFVTAVMIMTVSLVAIRQRYREVAIRRSEGARRRAIVSQLLLESAFAGLFAGLFALGLSRAGAAFIEARYISWPPEFTASDTVLALGLGLGISALATALPAWRAATLDPVKVLSQG